MEAAVAQRCSATRAPTPATSSSTTIPTNDAWCRDHGPDLRQRRTRGRREQAIVDWGYNAWGGKYPPYDLDDVVPTPDRRRARPAGVRAGHHPGGRLDRRERPGHAAHHRGLPAQPEPQSRSSTAARSRTTSATTSASRKILWLGDGIVGDDTDGHVDDLTRFVDRAPWSPWSRTDPADENYEPLQENLERLRGMTDQDGRPLRIVTLPMPRPLYQDGQRLPASYANFYIANGVVMLPDLRSRARRGSDGHAAAPLSRPRGGWSGLHRSGLGTRRLPLRHAAVARLTRTSSRSPRVRPAVRRSCPFQAPPRAARPRSG